MARMRKMVRMEEGPRTSGINRGERSETHGMEYLAKLQVKSVKRGRRRGWDPAVTAAELARENRKVRQERQDETRRGWMKNIIRVTDTVVKKWRPITNALREIRFYQKSSVVNPNEIVLQISESKWQGCQGQHLVAIFCHLCAPKWC